MEFFLALSDVGVNSLITWFNSLVSYFNQSLNRLFTPPLGTPVIIKSLYDVVISILNFLGVDMGLPMWQAILAMLGPITILVIAKSMFDIL